MTRFQDSLWAQSLDEGGMPSPAAGTAVAPGPQVRAPAGATAPEPEDPGDRHSRSWFDSSWDLRAGADVAELKDFPPEFRETASHAFPARPIS